GRDEEACRAQHTRAAAGRKANSWGAVTSQKAVFRKCASLHGFFFEKMLPFCKSQEYGPQLFYIAPRSFSTAIAALRPFTPITLPPGWVHAPQRYTPGIGVRAESRLAHI